MKTFIRLIAVLLAAVFCVTSAACASKKDENAGSESRETSSEQPITKPEGFVAQEITECIDRNDYKMRIGAYLWYGFMGCSFTNRHLEEFYDYREPLWGYGYNDISDMEFQIQLAYDYGLDFFAIDYYSAVLDAYNPQPADFFVEAKNSRLLDFCLIVIDADDNTTPNNMQWEDSCEKFIYYMTRDNALKVDGKPVIIFYVPDNIINRLGGTANCKKAFDELENKMIDLGYPGIEILTCAGPREANNAAFTSEKCDVAGFRANIKKYEDAGFDGFTSYNYIIFDKVNGSYKTTYKTFTDHFEDCWNMFSKYSDSRYAPNLLGGWDDRPRENEIAGDASYALGRTKEQFRDHILNASKWLEENPDNALGNLGFIYAWDEIDEGGYIIPTKGEGFEMLEGLKEAADILNGDAYLKSAGKKTDTEPKEEKDEMKTADNLVFELTNGDINFTGRWFTKDIDGVSHHVTVNDGSELQFAVKGTNEISVNFTVISKLKTPYFAYMIDGSEPVRQLITDTDITLPDDGFHIIRIITDGITEGEAKFNGEIGFAFRDVDTHGGELIGVKPKNKTVMFMGDSITEGVRALNMNADSDGNSATHSYPWYTAKNLGAVAINCGFAASGTVGAGSFAPFLQAVTNYSATRACDIEAPDVIVINYGHNDVYFTENDVKPRYNAALDKLREMYPDTPIFVVPPFSQTHADTIISCCEGRDYVTVIESNGWNPATTDGIHLSAAGAEDVGNRLANRIKNSLGEDFFTVS